MLAISALLVVTLGFNSLPAPRVVQAAAAEPEVNVIMKGKRVAFPDAVPFIDANSRVLVPVRFVSESLGADVAWHAGSSKVDIAIEG